MTDHKVDLDWKELDEILDKNWERPVVECTEAYLDCRQTWLNQWEAAVIEEQRKELEIHKYLESEKAGRDLGSKCDIEWAQNHAAGYRKYAESPEYSGFLVRAINITNKSGIHVRPSCKLTLLAREYKEDGGIWIQNSRIFLHREGIKGEFLIKGTPYVEVFNPVSILGFAKYGDVVNVAVYGKKGKNAVVRSKGEITETGKTNEQLVAKVQEVLREEY